MASIRKEILIEARAGGYLGRDPRCRRHPHAPGAGLRGGYEDGRRCPHRHVRQRPRRPRADRRHRRGRRRLGWSVVGGRLTHHNASLQVFADGEGRSRVVWIADLLPNDLAGDDRRHDRAGHGRHEADAGAGGQNGFSLAASRQIGEAAMGPRSQTTLQDRPVRSRQGLGRGGGQDHAGGSAGACAGDRSEGAHGPAHGLRRETRR